MVLGKLWQLGVSPIVSVYKAFSSLGISRTVVTMKLDSPQFQALFTQELTELTNIFQRNKHELRIAGGAVRDILMGKHPADIDFATVATPEQMKSIFEKEGIRMLNMKGERHGTVTVRLNDKVNFEVTTLRVDVVTNGRHADVVFTTDWHRDAERRDLTINAMFLGFDGTVYDYFNGIEDLKKRQVRFVGDPAQRIQEDYLRILRYFRFYGRIAEEPDNHDASILEAISDSLDGLDNISGERLMLELKKILTGRFSEEMMLKMIELDVTSHIGFPPNVDCEEFKKVHKISLKTNPNPVTLVTSLLKDEDEVLAFHKRMRMSNFERDLCLFLVNRRESSQCDFNFLKSLLFTNSYNVSDMHKWVCEYLKYIGNQQLLEEFEKWEVPKFPLKGNNLIENGIVKFGPHMAFVMTELKRVWVESNFQKSSEDLINHAIELKRQNKLFPGQKRKEVLETEELESETKIKKVGKRRSNNKFETGVK